MTDPIKAKIEAFKDWSLDKTVKQWAVFYGFFLFWDFFDLPHETWWAFLFLATIVPAICLLAVYLIDTYDYR